MHVRSTSLRLSFLTLFIAGLMASGCATKRIISQWSNPAYRLSTPPFERILVVAATDQTSIRRNFEDELVAELKTAGLAAFPSYQYIPEDGKFAEPGLKEAARKADADAVIITRLSRVEERIEIGPSYYDPYPAFGFYGWYSSAWYGGFYTPPRVYRYPVYFTETTLYDIAKDEVVWTGTIRTIDPENVDQAIENYVQTVVAALKEKNIVRG